MPWMALESVGSKSCTEENTVEIIVRNIFKQAI